MLSDDTHRQVDEALRSSRERGVSLAEELDRLGLLLTPEKENQIRHEMLHVLSVHVAAERVETLLRWHYGDGSPRTPRETWQAAQAWFDDFLLRERDRKRK